MLKQFESTCLEIGRPHNYTDDEIAMTKEIVRVIMSRMTPIKETPIKIKHGDKEFDINIEKAKELSIIK